ncbi:MAG: hypothetical protein DRI88_06030 [Bacteroidetes bacterium]|nr:MAG: hypothetical protein DRI72_02760 [Bacteroidota bacterium]RLD47543.1 MAG: hypothetical protein DRI88_06030 [Bacteroidota bacterium]RLD71103.1 MAG: hypothetical protein DRI87_07380 [Bacteroidota bacterium]RLD88262.1 MAG: hypothetical protein DRJ02_04300 [Bacteroidota bacterium]
MIEHFLRLIPPEIQIPLPLTNYCSFTGSNATFNSLWRGVSQNLTNYISYPKLAGEAGGSLNLLRWVSPRTIKETFIPSKDFKYPYMETE